MFCEDGRAPYGIPMLWPFVPEHFTFPWRILQGVKHGVPGDGVHSVISDLLSWHNFVTIGLEVAVGATILTLAILIARIRREVKRFGARVRRIRRA
jgi:hypothetical protein